MALDFQLSGLGLVSMDIANLFSTSMDIINYEEIEDIMKEYHNALVENGVTDYDWFRFSQDVEMALVEGCITRISWYSMMKPKTFLKFFSKLFEEKGNDVIKIF